MHRQIGRGKAAPARRCCASRARQQHQVGEVACNCQLAGLRNHLVSPRKRVKAYECILALSSDWLSLGSNIKHPAWQPWSNVLHHRHPQAHRRLLVCCTARSTAAHLPASQRPGILTAIACRPVPKMAPHLRAPLPLFRVCGACAGCTRTLRARMFAASAVLAFTPIALLV